jgi:predicted dehydrogenase
MKKLGVGFVGSGWMGSVELQRLAEREDVEVLGLFEPNAERGREVLAKVGLPADRLVGSYETLLGNPGVAAVFLASPNAFHGAQAIAAMKAGKHVFCEKPCATDFREFREQIELSRANPNLVTFVDYILYFDTMEARLREMVAADAFGTVTQIQVNYRHPVNIAGDKTWKLKKALVGDAIGMGVSHSISAMLNLMAPQARPAGVYATSLGAQVRGFEPDPVWNILIRFDNGATGFCFGNIDNGNGYDAYHNLYGTEGAFVFDSGLERHHKVRYWSARAAEGKWIRPLDAARCKAEGIDGLAWPAETTTPDSGNVVNHQTQACIGHFLDCVKSGTQSPLSFVNSAVVAEVGWAAMMSAGLGREVRMPLDWKEAEAFFEAEKKK